MMQPTTENVPLEKAALSFIEQLQIVSNQFCTRPNTPYLTGKDSEKMVALQMKSACKCWDCPTCAARNARRWIARIINGVNKLDGEWFMFTITAHEKWRGKESSVKNLRQGWKKLYNRMRETFGTSSYVKVWEMHKDTSFHLHGLIDTKISKQWLKKNARQCGMGYQVEIHHVDNAGQVAGYISKYFLKSEAVANEGNTYPRNLRRIEVSRNWPKLPDIKSEQVFVWFLNQTRFGQRAMGAVLAHEGYTIIDLTGE